MRALVRSPWAWAVVAVAARLAFLALGPGLDVQPYSDALDYHRLAAHLAAGQGFALGPAGALYPTTFRPPLLPFVVAPFYALFGPHYVVALLVQIALAALLVPAVAALARACWPATPAAAPLAAALVALWPTLVFFSTVLLTETLAALLVTVALVLAARLFARGGGALALGLGIALGLAALARPTALPLAALLVGWLALAARRPARARAAEALLVAAGLAFAVLPWTLRNHRVTGAWIPVTSGGGAALYDSNNPLVVGDPRWHGGAVSLRQVEPYAADFRGLDEVGIDRLSARRARAFLAEHPGLWPRLAAWKLARFFRPFSDTPVTGGFGRPGSPLARLAAALDPVFWTYGLLLPFFAAGWLLALARPRAPGFAPALAVLAQALLAVVYWGSLRMRAPVEPAIVALAAWALAWTWARRPRAARRAEPA